MTMALPVTSLLCSLLTLYSFSDGLLLDEYVECAMSQWSAWSQPHIYGMMYRERNITEHLADGDDLCSNELYEVRMHPDYMGDISNISAPTAMLPMSIRADLIIDNFLRPRFNHNRKRATSSLTMFRDLLLIVDASASIGTANFRTAKSDLILLLGVLCPALDPFNFKYNHAALLEFSSSVIEIFDFNAYRNTSQMLEAINNMTYANGGTRTDIAFDHAKQMFSTSKGMRSDRNVKKEVLIITDGRSNVPSRAIQKAKELHPIADVYGLVIGQPMAGGQQEIRSYVSSQIVNHLFASNSFGDLTMLVDMILQKMKYLPTAKQCRNINP